MDSMTSVVCLAALAHETRLEVFRLLVRGGPDGVPASEIAAALEVPGPTLSFHLKELRQADLVAAKREGRTIRYAPRFDVIGELVGFLTENCCGGLGDAGRRGRKTKRRGRKDCCPEEETS